LVQGIKTKQPDTVVILAGYPQDQIEAHKAAGIDAFIHLGADCLAINQWLQRVIGR
jgi:methylmalonyl-CoA mutase